MSGIVEARLRELGITLPEAAAPLANYVPYNVVALGGAAGSRPALVVISGQLPLQDGKLPCTGKVGAAVSVEAARGAARTCALNLLAQLRAACDGDLDRVRRVVRLGGFIAAPPEFTGHAQVMNGASDVMVEVFGEAGRHARTTVGVPSLPADSPVEVEGMFEIA